MAVALIDCDNFFASCERIMQPHLANVPVAVLSNNDGCVIARTNEVKAAGVKMGQPYHECERTLTAIGATVVSANFLLYRGCAKRLQSVLKNVPNTGTEVYSIDESFLFFDDSQIEDVLDWAASLRKLIFDWTGILVTVGVAQSRALAKVAVHAAKNSESHVADLRDVSASSTKEILSKMPIQDVWGVGRRLAPKLRVAGIRTAYDLANLQKTDPAIGLLNVTGRQLVADLKGWESYQQIEETPRQSMTFTRSFGAAITDKADIRSAVGSFTDSIATKLRHQGLVTGRISVFLRYREQGAEKHGKAAYAERIIAPTADVFALETAAQELVRALYVPGVTYKKAGVLVDHLSSADRYQMVLGVDANEITRNDSLMKAIDVVSEKNHAHIRPAVTYMGSQSWRGKRQRLSPYDHATWQTIPNVY